MPEADFTDQIDELNTFKSQFLRLQDKGDKIKFRIAGKMFYVGRHWIGEKEVVSCPRVASGDKNVACEYCEKFEDGFENPYARNKSYKAVLQFYYPIVSREFNGQKTGEGQIFQTSQLVHTRIKEAADAGINVYKQDWQITCNKGVPANYYSVVRLDPTPLTEVEQKEAETILEVFEKIKPSLEGKESSIAVSKEVIDETIEKSEDEDLLADLPL